MFLKCYSGGCSLLTRKQHSDYAVSSLLSILDKLRVMTRDGSGCEAPRGNISGSDSLLSGRGNGSDLRDVPHFFQLIVYLVERINLLLLNSVLASKPVSQAKYLLFLKIQMFGLR